MEKGIPPEKKKVLVDVIMGLRAVLTDPDEAKARQAAGDLIDKAVEELEKDEQSKSSMARSKEEKKRIAAEKRAAWIAEVEAIARAKEARERGGQDTPAQARNRALHAKVWEYMRGPEFGLWLEATTGEAQVTWLTKLEAEVAHWRERSRVDFHELEFIESRIHQIIRRHQWTNPEERVKWSAEVIAAKTPTERRRVILRLATPRWADMEKVVAVYRERDRLVQETGLPHDVDHFFPLVSPKVCGLHCEFNLRVIPASVNRMKSNRFEVG